MTGGGGGGARARKPKKTLDPTAGEVVSVSGQAVGQSSNSGHTQNDWSRKVKNLLGEAGPEQFITFCWKRRHKGKCKISGVTPAVV